MTTFKPTSLDDLTEYIDRLCTAVEQIPTENGAATEDGYQQSADALWQAAAAAFEYAAHRLAVTGYQGSYAALRFYGEVMGIDGPYRIVKAEDALYPQYDIVGDVRRWLTTEPTRGWVRDQAREKLTAQQAAALTAAPAVVDHWRRLAAGWAVQS